MSTFVAIFATLYKLARLAWSELPWVRSIALYLAIFVGGCLFDRHYLPHRAKATEPERIERPAHPLRPWLDKEAEPVKVEAKPVAVPKLPEAAQSVTVPVAKAAPKQAANCANGQCYVPQRRFFRRR